MRSTPTLRRLGTALLLAPLAACSLAGHQGEVNGPAGRPPTADAPGSAAGAGAQAPSTPVQPTPVQPTPVHPTPVHPTPATDAPVADAGEVTLRPGQQVRLADGVGLRYLRLVNDSRCPPGVQCIWAGDAEIAMQWTAAGGAARAFSLHTGQAPRDNAFGGHRVTLVSLARGPAPAAQLRLDRQDPPG